MPDQITYRPSIFQRLALGAGALLISFSALADAPAAAEAAAPALNQPQVSLKTSMGEIVLALDQEKAPKTVANFLQYVKQGFYKGTIFHRVIEGFMIQAGGMNEKFEGRKTNKPIKNESNNGLSNQPYTVAMAREDHPDSATSQFFINVADNAFLNHSAPTAQGWGYAVFGKVVGGKEVVDKIKAVKTGNRGGHGDVPMQDLVIEKAVVV